MSSNDKHTFIIGITYKDPFLDNYDEEQLECVDILDRISTTDGNTIKATFDKAFLRRMISSHLKHIRDQGTT